MLCEIRSPESGVVRFAEFSLVMRTRILRSPMGKADIPQTCFELSYLANGIVNITKMITEDVTAEDVRRHTGGRSTPLCRVMSFRSL
jgi:hypothetical protein